MLEWLKEARTEKGFTQQYVSGASGITGAAYSMIESGVRRPSVEVAKKIAKTLGFDWQLFFPNEPDTA